MNRYSDVLHVVYPYAQFCRKADSSVRYEV